MSEHARTLLTWIAEDPWRMACLGAVAGLGLPDGWIGAGFLRSLVWDRLHGRDTPLADVDVLFFDPRAGHGEERRLEARLREAMPEVPWSARNQARMHARNGDAPYRDTADAIAHWLETPTAVAARLEADGEPALLAPFGLDDLFALTLRPTPHARSRPDRLSAYRARLAAKAWERAWPGVRVVYELGSAGRTDVIPADLRRPALRAPAGSSARRWRRAARSAAPAPLSGS